MFRALLLLGLVCSCHGIFGPGKHRGRKEAAEKLLAQLDAKDADALTRSFTEDCQLALANMEPVSGRSQAKGFLERFFELSDSLASTAQSFSFGVDAKQRDIVSVEVKMTMTFTTPSAVVVEREFPAVVALKFRGSSVASFSLYADLTPALIARGIGIRPTRDFTSELFAVESVADPADGPPPPGGADL